MNAARIYKELSFVDDKYILESSPDENPKTKSRARIIKISALAAAVCAIAAAIIVPAALRGRKPVVTEDDTDTDTEADTAILIPGISKQPQLSAASFDKYNVFINPDIFDDENIDVSKWSCSYNPASDQIIGSYRIWFEEIDESKTISAFGKEITGKYYYSCVEDFEEIRFYKTQDKSVRFGLDKKGNISEITFYSPDLNKSELSKDECVDIASDIAKELIDFKCYSMSVMEYDIDNCNVYEMYYTKQIGSLATSDKLRIIVYSNGEICDVYASHIGQIDSSLNIDDQVEKISKELCGEWEEKQSDGSVHKFKKSVQDVYLSVLSDGTPYLDFTIDLKQTKEYTDEKGEKVTEDILHEAIELIVVPE